MPSPASKVSWKAKPSPAAQFQSGPRIPRSRRLLSAIAALMLAILALAGCAGMQNVSPPPGSPIPGENTTVTIQTSATANDQLSRFAIVITSITLTNKAGKTVTLFNNSNPTQSVEAVHLNAKTEPFLTVSIPQDIYTSAAVTVGNCNFSTVSILSGGLDFATYDEGLCGEGTGNTTVILASPLTISGTAMTLSFDLQVSHSFTLEGSISAGNDVYTIDPVFNLTASAISPQPTNDFNGLVSGLDGEITSVSGTDGFILATATGAIFNVTVDSHTGFQGVTDFSSLAAGAFVELDGSLSATPMAGNSPSPTAVSLLASRISVANPNAIEVAIGPVVGVFGPSSPVPDPATINSMPIQQQGAPPGIGFGFPFQYSGAAFQVSGQFTNIPSLPFSAVFSDSTMVSGQNVYITANSLTFTGGQFSPAATITLLPQTIDGTVAAVSNSNGFAVYSAVLAPYDLFPTLTGQQNQSDVPSNPRAVIVYADTNTQMLTSAPFGVGSVVRFTGLIFNDNGTLRMDCNRISNGVAE